MSTNANTRTSRTDYLTAAEVAAEYGISLSSAYELARHIPSWKPPCIGLRFRRGDVEEFIAQFQRDPVTGRRGRKSGTRRARRGRSNEVAPGWTAEALKREAGI